VFRLVGGNIVVNGRAPLREKSSEFTENKKRAAGEPDKGLPFLIFRNYFKKFFLGVSFDE
jgi:hypothetical protein